MKKIFVASLFLALGSLAQAAFIQCQPNQGTVVNDNAIVAGGIVFTCSPAAGADAGAGDDNVALDGFNVSAIKLLVQGSFQNSGGAAGATYSVQYNSTNNLGGNSPGTPGCTAIATSAGTPPVALGSCNGVSNADVFFDIPDVDVLGAFTVTVTASAGPNPFPFNSSASVYYEVQTVADEVPPPSIPEPSTYAMMAAGLVGFYMVRRRS